MGVVKPIKALEPPGLWINPLMTFVSWSAMGLSIAHAAWGFDWPLCWMRIATGLSCPGCGMIRSLSCLWQGEIPASLHRHPFGLLLWPLFLATAILSLGPTSWKARSLAWLDRRASATRAAYQAFVIAFVTFGVLRMVAEALR